MKNYDYSQAGYYFVTICVKNRSRWFGEIKDGVFQKNNYGEIVSECWNDLPKHYLYVKLDLFVIMPNHVHGIVCLVGNGLKPFPAIVKRHGLSEIIRGFKTFYRGELMRKAPENKDFNGKNHFMSMSFEMKRVFTGLGSIYNKIL